MYPIVRPRSAPRSKDLCIKTRRKTQHRGGHFTTDASALLNDESINVIVELIDDADAAYRIVKTALQRQGRRERQQENDRGTFRGTARTAAAARLPSRF